MLKPVGVVELCLWKENESTLCFVPCPIIPPAYLGHIPCGLEPHEEQKHSTHPNQRTGRMEGDDEKSPNKKEFKCLSPVSSSSHHGFARVSQPMSLEAKVTQMCLFCGR